MVRRVVGWLALASLIAVGLAASQGRSASTPVLFEGSRIILGDGRPPVERGAFLVQDGKITAVDRQGAIALPSGASRVDLSGKTVIPALVDVHVHIGYEALTSWGAANYTPSNVLNHLQREAFYGVAVTQSVGSSPTDQAIRFQHDQQAGNFPAASRFFFMPGMAPPNGGPDAILIKATTALHAVNEVSTAEEARAAVDRMASQNLRSVKIWVDDRRGTYPKMTPEVYNAVIDEAHRHQMMVHAHATTVADQKAVVRAGADVLVHIVGGERVDDELLALLREKKPYWTPVMGFGDRSEVCNNDPFIDQGYPAAALARIREESCGPRPAAVAREETLTYNFPKMIAAGARLILGTDAGIDARHTFGWAEHHELAHWVQLGLPPWDAIVAATSRAAQSLGLDDQGVMAPGKRADFVVLDANPLDDIHNTRRIAAVYLAGRTLDRKGLLAGWK